MRGQVVQHARHEHRRAAAKHARLDQIAPCELVDGVGRHAHGGQLPARAHERVDGGLEETLEIHIVYTDRVDTHRKLP